MTRYLPEETLIEKMQSGEYGWKKYIEHHSKELMQDYKDYCQREGLDMTSETSANQFMQMREEEFDKAMENGNA